MSAGWRTRLYYRLRRRARGALVLLYHRVANLEFDPQRLAVSPRHFSQHLQVLAERCQPMRLSDMIAGARNGTLPARAVAVTFDDGYADNLHEARPLLERFRVPAMFFLTSAYLERTREFWWDELERVLPASGDAGYDPSWTIERLDDPSPQHRTYRDLCARLRTLPDEERETAVQHVIPAMQRDAAPRPSHRVLRSDEVRQLMTPGMFEIGAHTATHPALSALPHTLQRAEIAECKHMLERMTGTSVDALAYPFGTRADYDRDTMRLVREAGFTTAYSARPGAIGRHTDGRQLPRVVVRNWNGDTFAEHIEAWL